MRLILKIVTEYMASVRVQPQGFYFYVITQKQIQKYCSQGGGCDPLQDLLENK